MARSAAERVELAGTAQIRCANADRRDAVRGQLELFRALAEANKREQQLGALTAYAYPQSLGEWLGAAVQLAGSDLR